MNFIDYFEPLFSLVALFLTAVNWLISTILLNIEKKIKDLETKVDKNDLKFDILTEVKTKIDIIFKNVKISN